mgnify:FL=1
MSKDSKTETKSPELKEEVLELSKKIESGLKIDKKTGVGTEEEDLYEKLMPETVNMDMVKAVHDYNTTFIPAATHAFGQMAVKAMAGNKELEEANVEIKMGVKDSLSIHVERSRDRVNHLGDGSTVTNYGETKIDYTVRAGKGNGGQLKVARNLIKEIAMKKLA